MTINKSFWEVDVAPWTCDVVIIGGGYVGLWSAYFLLEAQPERRVIVVDELLGIGGASTQNAGFACFGSLTELLDLEKRYGVDRMLSVTHDRYCGLQILNKVFRPEEFDLEINGSTEWISEDDFQFDEMVRINKLLFEHLELKDVFSIIESTHPLAKGKVSCYNQYEGSLHPMKLWTLLYKLLVQKGVQFVNGNRVNKIDCQDRSFLLNLSNEYQLLAHSVVVCTNGFTNRTFPFPLVTPARNMVMVSEPIEDFDLPGIYHMDRGYYYFRLIDNRLLLGGGRHLDFIGESTWVEGFSPIIEESLYDLMKSITGKPQIKIDYQWSGIMGMTEDGQTNVSFDKNGILYAVGLNGMGVALAPYVGTQVSQLMS